jgi:hypothetical protein
MKASLTQDPADRPEQQEDPEVAASRGGNGGGPGQGQAPGQDEGQRGEVEDELGSTGPQGVGLQGGWEYICQGEESQVPVKLLACVYRWAGWRDLEMDRIVATYAAVRHARVYR